MPNQLNTPSFEFPHQVYVYWNNNGRNGERDNFDEENGWFSMQYALNLDPDDIGDIFRHLVGVYELDHLEKIEVEVKQTRLDNLQGGR